MATATKLVCENVRKVLLQHPERPKGPYIFLTIPIVNCWLLIFKCYFKYCIAQSTVASKIQSADFWFLSNDFHKLAFIIFNNYESNLQSILKLQYTYYPINIYVHSAYVKIMLAIRISSKGKSLHKHFLHSFLSTFFPHR